EQASGSGQVDRRSDIYSLACVLYETLAGQPPFTGPTAQAIMARHSLDAVHRLKIVRDAIPDDLELVIERALEKVPADRYQTSGEFAKALTAASTGRVSRITAQPRRRRWSRRSSIIAAAVIALVVLAGRLVIGGGGGGGPIPSFGKRRGCCARAWVTKCSCGSCKPRRRAPRRGPWWNAPTTSGAAASARCLVETRRRRWSCRVRPTRCSTMRSRPTRR